MKVNVKQKDIDNGIGGDDNKCAIALAVKRAFNKGVDTTDVAVYYDLSLIHISEPTRPY